MADGNPQLNRFHFLVKRWFDNRLGRPTRIQQKVWPLIAANHHLLVTAPTGSGKTLAAFLWALDQLISQRWEGGQTRVLYVSPLKALNNDIQRNLIRPLTEIRRLFQKDAVPFPSIRVSTRSGDTPSSERRQMIRRPPEILITTPESLHLLLASHGGRSILGQIRTVILDEIHAVVGSKRGTLLMSAVERLVPLSEEFQRIGLSATVKPAATVAEFVGGFRIDGDLDDPVYIPRPVKLCRSNRQHQASVHVRIPDALAANVDSRDIWDDLADTFRQTIAGTRATIIFTNSRRLCEKLTFLINADRPQPVAYAHHGSLSRELRLEVEQRLKRGDLKAIVATATLELGIDIGSLGHVILVQSPPSISSAVQRIGRSGHGVGETSLATFYATHAGDALVSAVLANAVVDMDIEPVRPVKCPLDVLAQVMVAMTGVESWNADRLYHALRASYPFRDLKRRAFDLVVQMLAGSYANVRIASLKPKIAFDRLDNRLTARKGALLTLYTSGGVIPDRGYFSLRHQETGSRIGELDEEFVWEAKKGQIFTLGTQNWRIHRITHNDVFVRPASPKAPAPPFWKAEDADRDFFLSEKIARFLEDAQRKMTDSSFLEELTSRYCMDKTGARFLLDFLKRQEEKTGCPLPNRHHVVIERMPTGKAGAPVRQVVIHTFWGGRVNRPFGLALEAAYENRYGHVPSVFPTNDAIHMLLPEGGDAVDIMGLVSAGTVETLLRQRLEGSGVFGARFRECAARALLLPRRNFRQRMPLWLTRQKSQRLLDALGRFSDFPIILEAWRSCLQDDFDLPALFRVLRELEDGTIACSDVRTVAPSPMALSGAWRQVNQYMYADDRQAGRVKTGLSTDLIQEVVINPDLRIAVDTDTVDDFQRKRQRLHPGYAPDSPVEMLEWVKERLLVPADEWEQLLLQAETDAGISRDDLIAPIKAKLLRLFIRTGGGNQECLIVAAETVPGIICDFYTGREDAARWTNLEGESVRLDTLVHASDKDNPQTGQSMLAQWLRFYGPVSADFICSRLALEKEILSDMLSDLIETRALISGILIRGQSGNRYCDADNYETMLRMARRRRMSSMAPVDIQQLPLALAMYQGVIRSEDSQDDLASCLQPLVCLPLPAAAWESEILPARLGFYDPPWLDRLMQESELMWVGRQGQRVAFCHPDDLDLLTEDAIEATGTANEPDGAVTDLDRLFPDPRASYGLPALLGDPPRPVSQVMAQLWAGVWAGKITNDTMTTLRRGVACNFKTPGQAIQKITARSALRARSRRQRHGRSVTRQTGWPGNWRLIGKPPPVEGLMETAEIVKDRVRLLLDRYGILFRQILAREFPVFRWRAVFRELRLMELSGEIIAGCFFNDLPGLQFVSGRMLRMLRQSLPEDSLYWIGAQDPASVCGLGIDALNNGLPRRTAGVHLVYLGSLLAMVSSRNGKTLQIYLPMDHARLAECFMVFEHLLGRRINPLRFITVQRINGEDAAGSQVVEVLRQRFDITIEAPAVTVYRRPAT